MSSNEAVLGTTLFDGLIDDAAVFPPGSASPADALRRHRAMRDGPHARRIGPLLIPAPWAERLVDLLGAETGTLPPVAVGVIGASGDPAGLRSAVEVLERSPGVTVSHVEIAVGDGDPVALVHALAPLTGRGLPLAVEVSRRHAPAQLRMLAQQRELVRQGLLRGKFRTGGAEPGSVPVPDELAAVLIATVASGLPIKLTAGLHHAVVSPLQHGVLNVLMGVRSALDSALNSALNSALDGAAARVAAGLRRTDSRRLAAEIGGWNVEEATATRAVFTSFGCCGVLEPLGELTALGLIPSSAGRHMPAVAQDLAPAGPA